MITLLSCSADYLLFQVLICQHVYHSFFSFLTALLSKQKDFSYSLPYYLYSVAKLLQKSEMRKDIVIELSYKGFS